MRGESFGTCEVESLGLAEEDRRDGSREGRKWEKGQVDGGRVEG